MHEQIKSRWLKFYLAYITLWLFGISCELYLGIAHLATPLHKLVPPILIGFIVGCIGSYITLRCGYFNRGTRWLKWLLAFHAAIVLFSLAGCYVAYTTPPDQVPGKNQFSFHPLHVFVLLSIQIGYWIYTLKLHDSNGNYPKLLLRGQGPYQALKSTWLKYHLISYVISVYVYSAGLYEELSLNPMLSASEVVSSYIVCAGFCLLVQFLTFRYSYYRQGTFWLKFSLLTQAVFWIVAIISYTLAPQSWHNLSLYTRRELLFVLGMFTTVLYVQVAAWIYTFRLHNAYEKILYTSVVEANT